MMHKTFSRGMCVVRSIIGRDFAGVGLGREIPRLSQNMQAKLTLGNAKLAATCTTSLDCALTAVSWS